jgi:hypothetical protein
MLSRRSLLGASAAATLPLNAVAAPKAELWSFWEKNVPGAAHHVPHDAWNTILKQFLKIGSDGINRFAYASARDARSSIESYIAFLTNGPFAITQLPRNSQLGIWINIYNALTVKVVLDHYPVKSIRDIRISPGLFSAGPWGKKLVTIEKQDVSLDDIEHRILRPIWKDPRIHYAVNCASIGCPNLQREAFTPDNAGSLLDAAARAFVNHPRGVQIINGKLVVSSIYVWFKEDFGGDDAGVIRHLKRYASPELAAKLDTVTRIGDDQYDWSLNDAS